MGTLYFTSSHPHSIISWPFLMVHLETSKLAKAAELIQRTFQYEYSTPTVIYPCCPDEFWHLCVPLGARTSPGTSHRVLQWLRGAPGPARALRSLRRRIRASYPICKLPAQQMNQPSVSIFASLPELLLIPPNAFAAFFFFFFFSP